MLDVGAWGPVASGGRGRRWPRFAVAALLSAAVAAAGATASVATLAVNAVTENIDVVNVDGLEAAAAGRPLHVLVVGSDERNGLTAAERQALSLGDFDGARSDTVLLVSVSADRETVSMVSMPRDLLVGDTDGGIAKLTETYGGGRDQLVRAVTEDLGFPVNHYIEVSITGFIETVEVVGSVELCLDEPLRDSKSGANLEAGCQQLDPEQALAYVRSRQGARGDFERIERQQAFLKGMVSEVLDAGLLLEPGTLVSVAREVSGNLTVDDALTVPLMAELAQDLQGALTGGVEQVTVPGYTQNLDDAGAFKDFVVPYGPGLRALVEDLVAGVEVPSRGTAEDREDVRVALWSGGRAGAGVVESTLNNGGFRVEPAGQGTLDAGATTTVWVVPGNDEQAAWVAAHLGAETMPLPADVEVGDGVTVVVGVGDDAGTRSDPA